MGGFDHRSLKIGLAFVVIINNNKLDVNKTLIINET